MAKKSNKTAQSNESTEQQTEVQTVETETIKTEKPTVIAKIRHYQVVKPINVGRKGQVQQVVKAFLAVEDGTGEPVSVEQVTDELLAQCDGKYKIHILFRQEGRFANRDEARMSVLFHLHVLTREGFLREFDAVVKSDGSQETKSTRAKALVSLDDAIEQIA